MVVDYEQIADDIRWKLSLVQSSGVSLKLKARAIMDISDYLDEAFSDNRNINMFLLCIVDELHIISYKKFIQGFWNAMVKDESYELLHHLKKYFDSILQG